MSHIRSKSLKSRSKATFQALIDKCDDTDALILRARIRLQLPHKTDNAAAKAQKTLDDGFATCGGGDLEGAKAILTEALDIAEAGATVNPAQSCEFIAQKTCYSFPTLRNLRP